MKSGTTTLWEYLRRHPKVFLPGRKEPQFFSRDHNFTQGIDWYGSLFQNAREDQICGEASTCYSRSPFYPNAARRLGEVLPGAKLVYILRHPVDRLYSHYTHEMQIRHSEMPGSIPTFEDFLERDEEAKCASRYSWQIHELQKYFDPSQLKILLLRDLQENPRKVMLNLQNFLGLTALDLVNEDVVYANSSTYRIGTQLPRRQARRLVENVLAVKGIRFVRRFLPDALRRHARDKSTTLLQARFASKRTSQFVGALSELSPDTRTALCSDYREEADFVGKLLSRDLSEWLQ